MLRSVLLKLVCAVHDDRLTIFLLNYCRDDNQHILSSNKQNIEVSQNTLKNCPGILGNLIGLPEDWSFSRSGPFCGGEVPEEMLGAGRKWSGLVTKEKPKLSLGRLWRIGSMHEILGRRARGQCSKGTRRLLFSDFENSGADHLPPSGDGVLPGELNGDADSGKEIIRHSFVELLAEVLGVELSHEVPIEMECPHLHNLEAFRENTVDYLAPILFVARFDQCARVFIHPLSVWRILTEKAALFLKFRA
jgi:hypothetical protein